ncbi:MAG: porin family protein [Ferruginibacter sp.]
MKKLILSFAIVAIATLGANAQVKFGIKAGVNISTLRGDDVSDAKSLIGVYGGGLVNIPISTMFSVQPEVLYSGEGAKDGSDKLMLSYVNIPVLLKYSNPSGFFAELGPQIGILISAKAKSGGTSDDIKEFLKSSNFSLAGGLGYNFTPSIGAGIRYTLGLANIGKDSGSDLKTGTISIGLHYMFGGAGASK